MIGLKRPCAAACLLGLLILTSCSDREEDRAQRAERLFRRTWSMEMVNDSVGSKTEALEYLMEAAELGHAKAAYIAGQHILYIPPEYNTGEKFTVYTYRDALRLFQIAAKAGVEGATYGCGLACEKGEEYEEAFAWYVKAAEEGYLPAVYRVGICYLKGLGVPRSWEKGRAWLRRGAESGCAQSMFDLAVLYERGLGGEALPEEAERLYRESEKAGCMRAKLRRYFREKKDRLNQQKQSAADQVPTAQRGIEGPAASASAGACRPSASARPLANLILQPVTLTHHNHHEIHHCPHHLCPVAELLQARLT